MVSGYPTTPAPARLRAGAPISFLGGARALTVYDFRGPAPMTISSVLHRPTAPTTSRSVPLVARTSEALIRATGWESERLSRLRRGRCTAGQRTVRGAEPRPQRSLHAPHGLADRGSRVSPHRRPGGG